MSKNPLLLLSGLLILTAAFILITKPKKSADSDDEYLFI